MAPKKQPNNASKKQTRNGSRKKNHYFRGNKNSQNSNQPQVRTLKRSARKQIERERAPNQWILPRIHDDGIVWDSRPYPPASLLGLPREIRQQVLYETCDMESLEKVAEYEEMVRDKTGLVDMFKGIGGKKAIPSHLGNGARQCLSSLGKKIGVLCAVSPLIREEMQFVVERWYEDLDKSLNTRPWSRLALPPNMLSALSKSNVWLQDGAPRTYLGNERQLVKVAGKGPRLQKCWFCGERHDRGQVCPASVRDSKKWRALTKPVNNPRPQPEPSPAFKGKKWVFTD